MPSSITVFSDMSDSSREVHDEVLTGVIHFSQEAINNWVDTSFATDGSRSVYLDGDKGYEAVIEFVSKPNIEARPLLKYDDVLVTQFGTWGPDTLFDQVFEHNLQRFPGKCKFIVVPYKD